MGVDRQKLWLFGEALGSDDGAALAECGGEGGDVVVVEVKNLSLIHISEPTRLHKVSRMPSSA